MEKQRQAVNMNWLRTKMIEYRITTYQLGDASHIPQSAISAMLNGREYCGKVRAARIREAIVRLTDPTYQKPAHAEAEAVAE